jgi:hypothetical protein
MRARRGLSPAGGSAHDGCMTITEPISTERTELWLELAQQLRIDSIRATAVTNSGHPTAAMSAADLAAAGHRLCQEPRWREGSDWAGPVPPAWAA